MTASCLSRLLIAFAVALLPVIASAQDATVIGTVGNTRITAEDVQERLALSGGPRPGEPLEAAQERVANEMLAELLVERQLARLPRINPQLGAVLARERRQMMLDFFVQTNVERTAPTEEEIDAFIAENPQFFGDRASFWLNQFLVDLSGEGARDAHDAALAALRDGPLTPERILDFQRQLIAAEIAFQRQSVWRSSEQLPAAALAQLEEMHATGAQIEVVEADGRAEILMLLQRVADPADPVAQRPQIAQGMVQQSIAAQRDALIAQLAESVRQGEAPDVDPEAGDPEAGAPVIGDLAAVVPGDPGPDPGAEGPDGMSDDRVGDILDDPLGDALEDPAATPQPVATEPQRLWRPWMFVVMGGIGLMLPLVLWSGKGVTGALPRDSLWLWPARLAVSAVALLGLGATAWVVSRLWPLLGAQTALALGLGGLVMGILVAATWGRDQPWTAPDPRRAVARFAGIVAVQGVFFAAYVAFRLGWV